MAHALRLRTLILLVPVLVFNSMTPLTFVSSVDAHQGTPTIGEGFPRGVTAEELAGADVGSMPAGPTHFLLERLTISPDQDLESQTISGPQLLYIESGEVIIGDELGIEGRYQAGSDLYLPAGVPHRIRNEGTSVATVLKLTIAPQTGGVPSPSGTAGENGPAEELLEADLVEPPPAPAHMFIARLTWDPGADLGQNAFLGPIGVLGEEGTLSIVGPSGIEGQLASGSGVVFPSGMGNRQRNAGAEPAVAMVVGVLPSGAQLLNASTSLDVPVAGQALAPGVLYDSTETGGLDSWAVDGPWKQVGGMLVSDGSMYGEVVPPLDLGDLNNYAVEAEIQFARGSGYFGLFARGTEDGAYYGQIGVNRGMCSCDSYMTITNNGYSLIEGSNILGEDLDTNWHTYRLEVQGNELMFSLDGAEVETVDNQYLEGQGIGIFSDVQISVRSFRVVSSENP